LPLRSIEQQPKVVGTLRCAVLKIKSVTHRSPADGTAECACYYEADGTAECACYYEADCTAECACYYVADCTAECACYFSGHRS